MRGLPAPTVAASARKFRRVRRVSSVRLCLFAALAAASGLGALASTRDLIGQEAPDFALRAVEGGNMRLSEHRGEVVVLSFWGSRCAPCRTQLAALDRSLKT